MRTSPLDSLQENTPKAYITCPTLMFARKVANSSEVRGLSAKLHCKHLENGSDEQIIITMQNLGRNYPKFIYGMAHFEFGLRIEKKKKINRGFNANLTKPHLNKGPIAKMVITIELSGSNYPKTIYGVPCFENLVK